MPPRTRILTGMENSRASEVLGEVAQVGLKLGSPGIAVAAIDEAGRRAGVAAGLSSLRRSDRLRMDHRFAIGREAYPAIAGK